MDESSSAFNSRISDLKNFYPTKKSPHNQFLLKSLSLSTTKTTTECGSNLIKNDLNCSESSDSVITIDLSDDSLIESNDVHGDASTGNLKNIDTNKAIADEIDLISVDSRGHSDGNCSDDSVSTLVPSSPIGGKGPVVERLSTAPSSSYNLLDSDDDSFLDIPLSQRIGLTEDKPSDPKSLCSKDADSSDKTGLSWLDDDSLETWTFTKDPVPSSPGKSSPRKSLRNFCNSDESPFKRPTINNLKKLDKRPYQSDTPPNKFYTSLKEKNRKSDDTSQDTEKDDEEMYRIEETITPVRKRRTPEEIKKAKDDKEKRKAEKAEEKKAREKMKAKEKEKKAALREAGKTKLLNDCHKFCKTFVDVAMLEKFKITEDLQALFREKETKLILEKNNPIDSGIHWVREQRDILEEGAEEESTVNLIRREVEADIILKVLNPSEFIPLVNLSISKIELESSDEESDGEEPGQTLFEYVTSLLDLYDKNLTLILFGFDKYANQQKNRENAEYRARMGLTKRRTNKTKDALPFVKKCELDLALFDLQVKLTESSVYSSKRVHIIQTETPSDLCHIIWCHTKATAMSSIKKSQREQQGLEWYAQNDVVGSVDINTDGDITSLWTKQLMSFTKMSEEMAKAVTEVYACPQSLLAAYDKCIDETEKEMLLSGIEVHRKNYATGNTSKKLGPQVSRRIYLFMTTRNGDAIID